jgi:MYXO-CTERM domain-containing protein
MSEGLSDFLAAAITDDPGMGRGFFRNDEPLRHLDPDGREHIYPRDVGEIHYTGLIYGGMFWDLRKALIAELGDAAGKAKTLALFYGTVQRATDIPSALVEALATDDDDGNLDNGTPNECMIRTALGAHGLRTASGHVVAPGAVVAGVGQIAAPLDIQITGLSATCVGDEIESVDVEWRPGIGGSPAPGGIAAVPNGASWSAEIPLPIDGGRVDYQVVIRFADGTEARLPDNQADTFYQMFQGESVELYCTGFETDPFAEGWTRGGPDGAKGFEWGAPDPAMMETAFDPEVAYAGTSILALGLGKTYSRAAQDGPPLVVWAKTPVIDVGQYSDVHLQFRRWLTVEDGFFDQATISADGEAVWTNLNSMEGNQSNTHHLDLEWRFQNIPLSSKFAGPELELQFSMTADQGLEFGGWQIDEMCIVANPNSICGDGNLTLTEECDDGADNANTADHCRTYCRFPACGDGILDSGEACEPALDSSCLPACVYNPDAGCCSSSSSPTGPLVLGGLVALGVFRRRRRS